MILDKKSANTPAIHIKDAVYDKYNIERGVLKKHFDIIYKLEYKLQNFEKQIRKNEKGFNPDESIVRELSAEYQDLIKDFFKENVFIRYKIRCSLK